VAALERLGRYWKRERTSTWPAPRELFLLRIDDPRELPDELDLPSEHFVGFVAWETADLPVGEVIPVVDRLLDAGCVYFHAWGADSGRVHDIADESIVIREIDADEDYPDDAPLIMTTGEEGPLDEALFWVLYCTECDDAFQDSCRAVLALLIGVDAEVEQRIRYALEHPERFIKEVCSD